MCPVCGSYDLGFNRWDHGIDPETGYHDAGEEYACRDCGDRGDVQDLDGGKEAA